MLRMQKRSFEISNFFKLPRFWKYAKSHQCGKSDFNLFQILFLIIWILRKQNFQIGILLTWKLCCESVNCKIRSCNSTTFSLNSKVFNSGFEKIQLKIQKEKTRNLKSQCHLLEYRIKNFKNQNFENTNYYQLQVKKIVNCAALRKKVNIG